MVCCYAPSIPPGRASSPKASRSSHDPLNRTGVCVLVGRRNYLSGLGISRAGARRRGNRTGAPGHDYLAGHGGGPVPALFSCPAGRSVRKNGPRRRGAYAASRSSECCTKRWGPLVRAGAVSTQGTADAAKVSGFRFQVSGCQPPIPNPQPPSGGGSRSVFSQSHRDCSTTEREVMGAAGGDELEPVVATAGKEERSSPDVSRDLRLVHRR